MDWISSLGYNWGQRMGKLKRPDFGKNMVFRTYYSENKMNPFQLLIAVKRDENTSIDTSNSLIGQVLEVLLSKN